MIFTTPVDIAPSAWKIRYADRLLLLGSCFSDNIAKKAREYYLQVEANPCGTLYNPISIAHHVEALADKADVVLVTFGSAWVYIDKALAAGEIQLEAVVDNCEKRPASDFIRYRLSVEDIVAAWQPLLQRYRDKRWLFTVSPIRHKKDGLHENQLSKAILLQAIEQLGVDYFPSYEIMLDELRDYRYYAPDMLHPSEVAVDYIWERWVETYIDEATQAEMRPLHQLWLDRQHRPLKPDTAEATRFVEGVEQRAKELQKHYPWIQ